MNSRVLCAIFIFISFAVFAQDFTENLNVDIVNVYLTATDSKGNFVKTLTLDDFILKEDGVAQPITNFANFSNESSDKLGEKDVPLTIAFVIDSSNSMAYQISGQQKLDIVKNAAFRLIDELKPEDQVELIAFNEFTDEVTPLTHDKKEFSQDLLFQEVKGGNTALLDSIYFAMNKIKDQWGRKVIVVCSDGEDTSSKLKLDEIISNLVASDIMVLAFGTMALNSDSLRGRFILEKIAAASGGYAFFPTSLKKLDEVMEKLRAGMRSQYSLGYKVPRSKMDGNWRKIQIVCKKQGVKLRHREGYFANQTAKTQN
jgi:Ca-activated chloride channel homolog